MLRTPAHQATTSCCSTSGMASSIRPASQCFTTTSASFDQQLRQFRRHQQQLSDCRRAAPGRGHRIASTSSDAAGVEKPDVRKLASMAHIAVTDDEVADWQGKIESIVEWFGQLQAVDLEGVPPATRADVGGDDSADSGSSGGSNPSALRPDAPVVFGRRDDLLGAAPDTDGSYVRVPKIATGADDAA